MSGPGPNRVWINGQYVEVKESNVKFGPNVRIYSDAVKINGKYVRPTPPAPIVPGPVPGPGIWINGVNVGAGYPIVGIPGVGVGAPGCPVGGYVSSNGSAANTDKSEDKQQ